MLLVVVDQIQNKNTKLLPVLRGYPILNYFKEELNFQ